MPAPRVRPHVCHSCRRGGGEHGPYWESAFHYPDGITGAELRLYTCRECFANQLLGEGSPYRAFKADLEAAAASALDEAELARSVAQDLRAELDEARAALEAEHAGLSAEEVAALVIAGLEDRLPPPRAKAGSRR